MNILFITDNQTVPTSGGIERVVGNLAGVFTSQGNNCYHIYFDVIDENFIDNNFLMTKQMGKNPLDFLLNIIDNFSIDVISNNVINKRNFKYVMPLLPVINDKKPNIRTFYCYHTYPGYEMRCLPPFYCLKRILYSDLSMTKTFGDWIKSCVIKLFPKFVHSELKKKYRLISDNEKNLVLLSESYKSDFATVIDAKENISLWHSIGNTLSFPNDITIDIKSKEKIVLIVARLDETAKRITRALTIWNLIQKSNSYSDWRLIIVGDGPDRSIYERIVKKQNIRNITFEGRQPSLPYYQKASIVMMTSVYEGFPMVLIEAQQTGCVPVAFDSFGAVYDIIEDGKNGCVIPNNNLDLYAERLMWLMEHKEEREQMALNGIKSCQKFSTEKIAEQWKNLFEGALKQ